jgi:hypothetical protein
MALFKAEIYLVCVNKLDSAFEAEFGPKSRDWVLFMGCMVWDRGTESCFIATTVGAVRAVNPAYSRSVEALCRHFIGTRLALLRPTARAHTPASPPRGSCAAHTGRRSCAAQVLVLYTRHTCRAIYTPQQHREHTLPSPELRRRDTLSPVAEPILTSPTHPGRTQPVGASAAQPPAATASPAPRNRVARRIVVLPTETGHSPQTILPHTPTIAPLSSEDPSSEILISRASPPKEARKGNSCFMDYHWLLALPRLR